MEKSKKNNLEETAKPKSSKSTAKPKSSKSTAKPKSSKVASKKNSKKPISSVNKEKKRSNIYQPNLLASYNEKVMLPLKKQLKHNNLYEVPSLLKISLNIGIGNAREEKNALEHAISDLTTITGQQAVVTKAKKAISNFKLRVGDPVGARVTLRRWHMFEFLERLINIALPRVRDFSGLSAKSFDGRGNYSFGIQEQIVFPEIDYDKIDKIRGLDVTITTSANSDEEAYSLLKILGFPFRLDNHFERLSELNSAEKTVEEANG